MRWLAIYTICAMGFLAALSRGEAQTPPFVDADGDGINDALQGMHRVRGRMRGGGDWTAALSKLKLTADQQTRLRLASRDYRKTVEPIHTALGAAQTRLKEAMGAAQPDQKTIETHIDAIGILQSQAQKADAAYRLTVQGILTPDQWAAVNPAAAGLKAAGPGAHGIKKGGFDIFVDEDGDGICDGRGVGRKPPPGPEEHRQDRRHPGK
jgi:Spy/CpxP family protein refolding chaperone